MAVVALCVSSSGGTYRGYLPQTEFLPGYLPQTEFLRGYLPQTSPVSYLEIGRAHV